LVWAGLIMLSISIPKTIVDAERISWLILHLFITTPFDYAENEGNLAQSVEVSRSDQRCATRSVGIASVAVAVGGIQY